VDANLTRAARLSALPGITLAVACERFRVPKAALQRARKELGAAALRPSREDLVLAILTDYATATEGTLPDLARVASYIDFVEKDGCTPDEVRGLLGELARSGALELSGSRWKLLQPWPPAAR
jgi:hypothetical protein